MSEKFDAEEFERLKGMPLAIYTLKLAKKGIYPPDCLNYFRQNTARWDGQHLEAGMMFPAEIKSEEAVHEIANLLGHALKHIRLTVLAMLDQIDSPDDYVLGKLKERLPTVTDDFEKHYVTLVYKNSSQKRLARNP
jgi:hypothetical protein